MEHDVLLYVINILFLDSASKITTCRYLHNAAIDIFGMQVLITIYKAQFFLFFEGLSMGKIIIDALSNLDQRGKEEVSQ